MLKTVIKPNPRPADRASGVAGFLKIALAPTAADEVLAEKADSFLYVTRSGWRGVGIRGGSGGEGEEFSVVGVGLRRVPAVFFVEGGLFQGDGAVDLLG